MWRKNTNLKKNLLMPTQSQPPPAHHTFDRVVRIVIALTIAGGVWARHRAKIRSSLPFLVAWLVAYMLRAIRVQYNKRLPPRPLTMAPNHDTLRVCLVVAALGGLRRTLSPRRNAPREADFIGRYTRLRRAGSSSPDVHQWIKETVDFEASPDASPPRHTRHPQRPRKLHCRRLQHRPRNIQLVPRNPLRSLHNARLRTPPAWIQAHGPPLSTAPRSSPSPTTSSAP